MILSKTEDLIANVEKKIEFAGGLHLKIKNLGEDTVYISQHNSVVAGADGVKSIQAQTTDIVTDVAKYSIKNSVGDYRGTIYALATKDCQIELEATNNSNFRFIKKGGGSGSNDRVSNFIANSDYTMLLDNYVSQYLGDYKETLGIVTQPLDVVLSSKVTRVKVKIVASGEDLKYQWSVRENENSIWLIIGATTRTDTMTIEKGSYSQFKCVVTDKYNNKVTSDICTVTILEEEE